MMKRLYVLVAAVLMTAVLCSCSYTPQTEDYTHNHTHESTTESLGITSADTAPSDTVTTTVATEVTEATEEATAPKDTEIIISDGIMSKGTIDGDVYKSTCTGLKLTITNEWKFHSDHTIAHALELEESALSEDNFAATAASFPVVFDVLAENQYENTTITIAYENTLLSTGSVMTPQEYLQMIELAVGNSSTTTFEGSSTVTLSGYEYLKAVFRTSAGDVSQTNTYYLRSVGDYINYVLVKQPDSVSDTTRIEAMFG